MHLENKKSQGTYHEPALKSDPISNLDLDFVKSSADAVLYLDPKGGRAILYAVIAFVLTAVIWASLAKVDEFTRGEGRVIPSQQVQIIQNLEGGILAEFFVQEGASVTRGQALLRIDDTRFSSSLREADITLRQLELKSSRLKAEAEGEPFSPLIGGKWTKSLVEEALSLYESRQETLSSSKQVLAEQVEQKKQELSSLRAKSDRLVRSLNLLEQELERTRDAAKGGAISEVELLRLERQVNDLRGESNAARLDIPRAESLLKEVKEKLANVDLVFRNEAREELNSVALELAQLSQTSQALVDRVQRTMVKSPVTGTVKRFLVNTVGGVIQPGMDIVEVVPSEEIMLVEAKVRPADIAYLHPGQLTKIRFSAYDFSVFGGLDGKLVHISPDTIEDEKGNSYYLVRVEAEGAFVSPDGRELPVISGMTVSVDVLTGEKSIMSYLLKPILKTKQLAFSER